MLDPAERHSALTINEYETLLMKYDLAEVLRNPLRFFAEKSRHALANPRAVPAKTLGYAKYDFVRVLNKSLDTLGLRGSIVEKVLARTLAVPAARFFRMRRSVSLLVSERRRRNARSDRRHLPEPDSRAVAARAPPDARPRSYSHGTPITSEATTVHEGHDEHVPSDGHSCAS